MTTRDFDDLSRLTWAGSSSTPACSGAPTPSDTGSLAGTSASYNASYAYDAMNGLTSGPLGSYTYGDANHADAATAIGSSYTASYDEVGNLVCRAAPGSGQTCAGSSPTGAMLGYDNEERLFGWQNAQTNPTASTAYLYDGAGQRVQRVVTSGGTTTVTSYVGSQEEVTQSGSTTTTTAYYGGIAESVNGALSYVLSDGLGSVSEAVNTSGQVSATQLYGPYGGVRYQSGTLPTDKGYTGQVSDAASTGLDYYGARYYDPVAGQFTSADTTLAGGLNRYAYVAGNPETRTDPSGHVYTCPTGMCGPSAGGNPTNPPNPTPTPTSPPSGSSPGGNGSGGNGCSNPACVQQVQTEAYHKAVTDIIAGGALSVATLSGILAACFGPLAEGACGIAIRGLGTSLMQGLHLILSGIDAYRQLSGVGIGDVSTLIVRAAEVQVDLGMVALTLIDAADFLTHPTMFLRVAKSITGIGEGIEGAVDVASYDQRIAAATSSAQRGALRAALTRGIERVSNKFADSLGGITGAAFGTTQLLDDTQDFWLSYQLWQTGQQAS